MEMSEIIARINAFTKLAGERELDATEQQERQQLRAAYMSQFRANFRQQLDSTFVQSEDGAKVPLKDWHSELRRQAEDAFSDEK